jgi:DNA-binding response OmpR family regulator
MGPRGPRAPDTGSEGNDVDDRVQVLLVEDDEDFADMYRLKLEADGYEVEIATDGEDGVRKALAGTPDLIFLDIRMPRVGGLEMLERVRAEPRIASVPVVILSNYGDDELRKRGYDLGALEWLIKANVTPTEVSNRIRRWSRTGRTPKSRRFRE